MGIIRCSDADYGRYVTSASSGQGLAGCSLAADAEALYLTVSAGAFRHYHFQNVAHGGRSLLRDDPRLHRKGKGLFHLPVPIQRLVEDMLGDPVAAFDNGGRRGQQLDCCDLERLPESHGSQLHISHILFFMHDSPSFSRQVDAGALF